MTNFKPKLSDQKVIGMMMMQGWNKDKIVKWHETCPEMQSDKDYLVKLIQWLIDNLGERK